MTTNHLILVPLDGSRYSESSLACAEMLARLTGRSLRLLTVVEPIGEAPWGTRQDVLARLKGARIGAAAAYLEGITAALHARGIAVETAVQEGDAVKTILAAEQEPDIDLVAIATRGRGGVQRLLLGSVADKVVRLGNRPTVLITPVDAPMDQAPALRRIMVPLDGSQPAETALMPAGELARAAGATLVLVRAERHLAETAVWAEMAMYNMGEVDEEIGAMAAAYLEEVKRRLGPDTAAETVTLRGFPIVALENYIAQGGIDFIVMATHGRGGVGRLALGSVADRLTRLGVPTLLVRRGADAAATPERRETAKA